VAEKESAEYRKWRNTVQRFRGNGEKRREKGKKHVIYTYRERRVNNYNRCASSEVRTFEFFLC
jgi:hypothetical protein